MAWDKKYSRQEVWTEKNKDRYVSVSIRLNKVNDADILDNLPEKNTSTRIKELIRKALKIDNEREGSDNDAK